MKYSLQSCSLATSFAVILLVGCSVDSTQLGLLNGDGSSQQNLDATTSGDSSHPGAGGAGEGGSGGSNSGGHSGSSTGGGNGGSSGGGSGGVGGGAGGAGGGGTGTVCGTIAGLSCSDGTYCELPPASCNTADAAGTCTVKPQVCTAIAAPVCGCDGKTYGNDCNRQSAGVSKAADGACPTGAGGSGGGKGGGGGNSGGGGGNGSGGNGGTSGKGGNGGTVGKGGSGGGAGGVGGILTSTGGIIGAGGGGVVGSGGIITSTGGMIGVGGTTSNGGTSGTGTGGNSGTTCGGIAGLSCSNGMYCEFPVGTCGANDISGACTMKPEVCPALAAPVCGCDGKTYINDCIRQDSAVSKLSDGACPAGTGGSGGK